MQHALRGRTRLVLAVAALMASPLASAATVFSVSSQPGDPVGLGESRVYTDADATLSIEGGERNLILRAEQGVDQWYLSLGAPVEQVFQPRRFAEAEHPTRRSGRAPYLFVSRNGQHCDPLWGEIQVRQFRTDAQGRIEAVEAAVVQRCHRADAPLLAAVIRHNTQPLSLRVDSQAGDYVGEGLQRTYYGDTSLFQLWGDRQALGYTASGRRDRWSAELYAPTGQALAVGRYAIAETPDAQHAGFRFERPERRCPAITGGSVEIKAIGFDPDTGAVQSLHAEFVQYCQGATQALRGTLRYQA